MSQIWDHSNETMDREDLAQVQLERLQASVFRAYQNVAFYRRRFDERGIAPEDIQSLADLRHLPFTTKEDLRCGYPYEMLAVALREVVRLHSTTGTTGRPTICAFTRNDLRHWSELVARVLSAAGVTRDDVVQIFFGAGLFTGGLGFHGGAERIGASVIPASTSSIEQQIGIMQDFRTTAIVGTPSYAAQIADVMAEKGIAPRRLSMLKMGLFGGEPWSEKLRAQIEEALGISATDNYGLSEVGGPGVAGECGEKQGLHIAEDHFLVEVIDPETGEQLPEGQEGELVLTTLTREALPLIRYRTRDLTRLTSAPCPCGRTLARMARVHSRTDDMIIVQGVNMYPAQIEAILMEVEGAQPHYQILLERRGGADEVEILVELSGNLFVDSVGKLEQIERRIISRVQDSLGIAPRVRLVEPKTLSRSPETIQRVVDKRG